MGKFTSLQVNAGTKVRKVKGASKKKLKKFSKQQSKVSDATKRKRVEAKKIDVLAKRKQSKREAKKVQDELNKPKDDGLDLSKAEQQKLDAIQSVDELFQTSFFENPEMEGKATGSNQANQDNDASSDDGFVRSKFIL